MATDINTPRQKSGPIEIEKVLTNSLRNLYTSCPRRFFYGAVENLVPIVTPRALQIGTLVHVALADFYGAPIGGQTPDPEGAVIGQIQEFEKELGRLADEDEAQRALEEARSNADLALDLFRSYVETWGKDESWQVLGVERKIEMRLKTPKGTPSHWRYRGTLDLIVRDLVDGRVKVVDHKTAGHSSKERFTEELMMDPQSPGYIMLLDSEPSWKEVGPIGDFIFNVLRKKLPADPKTLVCKKCNTKWKKIGGTMAEFHAGYPAALDCPTCRGTNVSGLSQAQGVDTTPEKFREALARYPHLDPSDYQEVLDRLEIKAGDWMYRVELDYSPERIQEFHQESYEITRTISESRFWTRDFTSCFRPGRRCSFRGLCLAENRQDFEEAMAGFRVRGEEVEDGDDGVVDQFMTKEEGSPF